MIRKRFLFLLAVCLPTGLQAANQINERIYIDGREKPVRLCTVPLESLDELRHAEFQRRLDSCNTVWFNDTQTQRSFSTALHAGYRATWSLYNDSLRLLEVVNMEGALAPESKYARHVPTEGIVRADGFADWFTGELRICMGGVLNTDLSPDDKKHETEWICTLDRGVVTSYRKYANRFIGANPKASEQAFKQTCKEKLLPKNLRSKYYKKVSGRVTGRTDEAGRVHDLKIRLEFYRDANGWQQPDAVCDERDPRLEKLRRQLEKVPWYGLYYNGEVFSKTFYWRPLP